MHRQPLLNLLAEYGREHPDEQACVTRFTDFVRTHPTCFERSLPIGHVTGSAWVISADGDAVLLTHHRKLDIWVQFGGHADGDPDILRVARREATEESGLDDLHLVEPGIFDLDIHPIPARKTDPAHDHYDVRFAFRAAGSHEFTVSDESHDLAWVPLAELERFTREPSMLRMRDKWLRRHACSSD